MMMSEDCLGALLECLADIEIATKNSEQGPGKMIADLTIPLRRLYHDIDSSGETHENLMNLRNRNWQ